jgi:hypothetical protein
MLNNAICGTHQRQSDVAFIYLLEETVLKKIYDAEVRPMLALSWYTSPYGYRHRDQDYLTARCWRWLSDRKCGMYFQGD